MRGSKRVSSVDAGQHDEGSERSTFHYPAMRVSKRKIKMQVKTMELSTIMVQEQSKSVSNTRTKQSLSQDRSSSIHANEFDPEQGDDYYLERRRELDEALRQQDNLDMICKPPFHNVTLRFLDDATEKKYKKDLYKSTLYQLHIAISVGTVLLSFYAAYSYEYRETGSFYVILCSLTIALLIALAIWVKKEIWYPYYWYIGGLMANITVYTTLYLDGYKSISALTAIVMHLFSALVRLSYMEFLGLNTSMLIYYTVLSSTYMSPIEIMTVVYAYMTCSTCYTILAYFVEKTDRISFSLREQRLLQQEYMEGHTRKARSIMNSVYPRVVADFLIQKEMEQPFFTSQQNGLVVSIRISQSADDASLISNKIREIIYRNLGSIGLVEVYQTGDHIIYAGNIFEGPEGIPAHIIIEALANSWNMIAKYVQRDHLQAIMQIGIGIARGCVFGGVHNDRVRPFQLYGDGLWRAIKYCNEATNGTVYMDEGFVSLIDQQTLNFSTTIIRHGESYIHTCRMDMLPKSADFSLVYNMRSTLSKVEFQKAQQTKAEIKVENAETKFAVNESKDKDAGAGLYLATIYRNPGSRSMLMKTFLIVSFIFQFLWGLIDLIVLDRIHSRTGHGFQNITMIRFGIYTPCMILLILIYVLGVYGAKMSPIQAVIVHRIPTAASTIYALLSFAKSCYVLIFSGVCLTPNEESFMSYESVFSILMLSLSPSVQTIYALRSTVLWCTCSVVLFLFRESCSAMLLWNSILVIIVQYVALSIVLCYGSRARRIQVKKQIQTTIEVEMETERIAKHKRYIESIVLNILPPEAYLALYKGEKAQHAAVEEAIVLVVDICSILTIIEGLDGVDRLEIISGVYKVIEDLGRSSGIEPVKPYSSTYLLRSIVNPNRVASLSRAVLYCHQLSQACKNYTYQSREVPVDLSFSIDIGNCFHGFLGMSNISFELWGAPVTAARDMVEEIPPNTIRVSSTVKEYIEKIGGRTTASGQTRNGNLYHVVDTSIDPWEYVVRNEILNC